MKMTDPRFLKLALKHSPPYAGLIAFGGLVAIIVGEPPPQTAKEWVTAVLLLAVGSFGCGMWVARVETRKGQGLK